MAHTDVRYRTKHQNPADQQVACARRESLPTTRRAAMHEDGTTPHNYDPQANLIATQAAQVAGGLDIKMDQALRELGRLNQAVLGDAAIGHQGLVAKVDEHGERLDKLEDYWRRVIYVAIGASVGTTGLVTLLARIFGSPS